MSRQDDRRSIWRQVAEIVVTILASVVVALSLYAPLLWFITFLDPQKTPYASGTPFMLAQVVALFGAFGLAGGFSGNVAPNLRNKLCYMGVVYIVSAFGFSLLGMVLPFFASLDERTVGYYFMLSSSIGAFGVAWVTFGLGTILFLLIIRSLIEDKVDEGTKGCSSPSCNKDE